VKRRHFLGGAAALASASLWPSWLREAFAEPAKACDPRAAAKVAPQSVLDVATAFRKASRAKRPLLVFIIPAEDGEKWNRGHAFGELLNHGSDADLAPLADCDVVCATMEGLRKVVPSVAKGEPLMVLVRTTALPATSEPLDAEMPSYNDMIDRSGRPDSKVSHTDKVIAQRIAVLGGLLRRGLGSSPARIAARAAEARARLREKPPAGTRWARSEGCGVIIEDDRDPSMFGCGMAFVPEKSKRFLYFYSSNSLL
jgi:hypothetical protein